MIARHARTVAVPVAVSLGLHAGLLLVAAWATAVLPERRPVEPEPAATEAADPDISIVLVAAPELMPAAPPEEKIIVLAPQGVPEEAPANPDTRFVSSQNTRASSAEAPDAGADPDMVKLSGHELANSLENIEFRDGGETPAKPQPSPPEAPEPPPVLELRDRPPEPLLQASDGDRPPPPPKPVPAVQVSPPSETRQAQPVVATVKAKASGGVSRRAAHSSVDAVATAEGKYTQIINERLGLIWNRKMTRLHGLAGIGTVQVQCEIDRDGRVGRVRLVEPGTAPAVLEDICLSAVIAVKLPPPPPEMQGQLQDALTGRCLRQTFTFTRL